MPSIRPFNSHWPVLGHKVYIDEAACVIGQVTLGEDSSVWPFCSVRGDVHEITIGKRTNIQDNTVCHVTHKSKMQPDGYPLIIGDNVTVGHSATLHACTIKDRVLIGMGAIILDGAIIESEVLVAAGSLVPPKMHLESGYLYMGNPVIKKRELSQKERDYFCYSSSHYVKLKNQYLDLVTNS